MANFYLDASAIGNEYQAYSDIPATWAVPQDGNGKAFNAAVAAVSVATLDCASASASGAGAISLLGITVSSALTGSGATLAANIVAAINSAASAVTSTYCQALLPLNKLVFARQNPALTTQVQVMLRVAGADWNGITPVPGGTWGTPPTMGAFSGGVDGPFGYLFNSQSAAFGKSGGNNASMGWGLAPAGSPGTAEPTANDPIYIRTRRGGSDIVITHSNSNGGNFVFVATGKSRWYFFDDGVVWAGDDGMFTCNFTYTYSGGNASIVWNGKWLMSSPKKYGFKFNLSGDSRFFGSNAGDMIHENVWWCSSIDAGNSSVIIMDSMTGTMRVWRGVRYTAKGAGGLLATSNPAGNAIHHIFDRCLFEFGAVTSGIISSTSAYSFDTLFDFTNCEFKDRNDITSPILASPFVNGNLFAQDRVVFDNCTGVAPFTWPGTASASKANMQIIYKMPGIDGAWRIENGVSIAEWRPAASFPYRGSMLPSGQMWSIKCALKDCSNEHLCFTPLVMNAIYRGSTAVKTITVELLIPVGVDFKKTNIGIVITYTKSDGSTAREDSFEPIYTRLLGGGAVLAAGAGDWTMNGTSGYASRKLTLTTSAAILTGTKVVVRLQHKGRVVGNTDRTIFVDPEPQFS